MSDEYDTTDARPIVSLTTDSHESPTSRDVSVTDSTRTITIRLENTESRSTSWLNNVVRHPLFLAVIGFIFTGVLGAYLTYRFNDQTQQHEIEISTRNDALAAVNDLSDLVNERRERAILVISSIRRGAPEGEINARKLAYDEAYIRWNAKVPGDLLRIRAGLGLSYRSSYERYVDGMTNFNIMVKGIDPIKLLHGQQMSPNPGLLSIMDTCLTQAFDTYRANSFKASADVLKTISDCKFAKVSSQSISCFSTIGESLYSAVESGKGISVIRISDDQVVEACRPP